MAIDFVSQAFIEFRRNNPDAVVSKMWMSRGLYQAFCQQVGALPVGNIERDVYERSLRSGFFSEVPNSMEGWRVYEFETERLAAAPRAVPVGRAPEAYSEEVQDVSFD